MKKDWSSLGVIPSAILGMLGYSSGIGLLRLTTDVLGQPMQADSVEALEDYRWVVAILFALSPWLVLLLSLIRRGWEESVPIGAYFVQLPSFLLFAVLGWVLEVLSLRLIQAEVDTLMPGERWVFAVSDLHPLRTGLGAMILCWVLLFVLELIFFKKKPYKT